MPTLLPGLRGRDVGSVILTGQTEDIAGVLADGSSPAAQTVTGILVSWEETFAPEQSEIAPITTTSVNNVIEAENNSIRIGILLLRSGVINALKTLAATYEVIKAVAVTKGSGATTTPTAGTTTFIGRRGEMTTGIDSRGRNVAYLTLTSVDIGSTNPTYT